MAPLSFAFCLHFVTASQAQDARRVALVIGNGAYEYANALENPANDATDLAAALEALGFDVDLQIDVDQTRMSALISALGQRTNGAEVALFFYAGHGFQIDGRNYLMPVDAQIGGVEDVASQAWDMDVVFAKMAAAADVKILLLDACRDNPFEEELTRSLGPARAKEMLAPGLAPLQPAGGVLVGFATDPGNVAYDGAGDNSPFTSALLRHLPSPGVEINSAMTRVRADVFADTGQRQRPWTTTSLIRDVYLAGQLAAGVDEESADWQAAESSGTHQAVKDFAQRYPNGALTPLAELQLAAAGLDPGQEPEALGHLSVGDEFRDCLDCPRMTVLPAGQFTMGVEFGPDVEKPPTLRAIARAFAMGRAEVTRREWSVCAEAGSCRRLPGPVDEVPASGLSWDDAQDYVDWLADRTGRPYRLPSETEWEYAAQGNGGLRYPTGPVLLPKSAYFGRDGGAPVPVASYEANAFGLYDLAGNVWEWVEDCGARYDVRMTGAEPVSARPCIRILRGGGFRSSADQLRTSNRFFVHDGGGRDDFGLRVALNLN